MARRSKGYKYELESDSSDPDTVDDDRDLDYNPSTESCDEMNNILDNCYTEETVLVETHPETDRNQRVHNNAEKEIVYSSDLSLNPIVKNKSTADAGLWKYFGVLMNRGTVVKATSNRVFCSLCLDTKVLKRSVLVVISSNKDTCELLKSHLPFSKLQLWMQHFKDKFIWSHKIRA